MEAFYLFASQRTLLQAYALVAHVFLCRDGTVSPFYISMSYPSGIAVFSAAIARKGHSRPATLYLSDATLRRFSVHRVISITYLTEIKYSKKPRSL